MKKESKGNCQGSRVLFKPKSQTFFFVDAQTLEACILHQEQKAAQYLTHKQCFAKFSLGLFQQKF